MKGRIKVYIPTEMINDVAHDRKPDLFWLSKPKNWDDHNLAEVWIPTDVYKKWTNNIAPKNLLLG